MEKQQFACLYIDNDYKQIIESKTPPEFHDTLYLNERTKECFVTERQLSLLLFWLDANKCKNRTFINYLQDAGHNCFNW